MNLSIFGNYLQTVRKGHGLTAEDLAERADISPVFVRQIEGGKKAPSMETFITLCNVLQVQPAHLLKGNITINENSDTNLFLQEFRSFSPTQIEMVKCTVRAMAKYF